MYTQSIIDNIKKIVSIKSVKQKPLKDKPFGEGIYKTLNFFLELASSLGFKTINYDNYIGEIIYGEGEDFAILCHLDTVPSSSNWSYPPFEATEVNGRIYGRGTVDDKSAAIICLFALKRLKDEGYLPNKRIKLIVGCDEESGWACIAHYKTKAVLPKYGFSPDSDFPVIYAEKGILHIEVYFKLKNVEYLIGGDAANMVCDFASAKLKKTPLDAEKYGLVVVNGEITSTGKSAHGSMPEKGINALDMLVKYLEAKKMIEQGAHSFLFGQNKLRQLKDQTGNLTMSPNIVKAQDDKAIFTVDIRYPATMQKETVLNIFEQYGISYKVISQKAPLMSGKDSKLVKALATVYNKVMGENLPPKAIGGGTYARALECGVAFGPEFPDRESTVHQDDEYIEIADIPLLFEIYYQAVLAINKLKF